MRGRTFFSNYVMYSSMLAIITVYRSIAACFSEESHYFFCNREKLVYSETIGLIKDKKRSFFKYLQ